MWQYRELIWNLTVVELKKRYQNTALGFFWSLLSPLLVAGVLYYVFRHVWGRDEDFALNLLVGMMAWQFFATGTGAALQAIVGKASLVTKVYIPRQVLVLSNVLVSLINSLLAFVILLPIIYAVQGHLPVTALLYPLLHLLFFIFLLGAGLFLSALYVYFRDLAQIWEVVLRALFFSTPIFYPLAIVPPHVMPYYMLNPVTRFMTMYRQVMITGTLPSLDSIAFVIAMGLLAYLVGNFVFNRLQRRFAEVI